MTISPSPRLLYGKLTLLISSLVLVWTTAVSAQPDNYTMAGDMQAQDMPADIYSDSLARLPQVQRQALDQEGQTAFDLWVRPGTGYGSGLRGPVGMWMHSPALATSIFDVRQRVRYGTAKDPRLTELTIISTAREINNQYEYSAHEPLAVAAGLEQEIIDLVRFRQPLDSLNDFPAFGDRERAIVQFTREVISEEKVSSDTFATTLELFGAEGLTDLVGLIGYYNLVAITLKAFDVQRPVGSPLLLPVRQP